MPHPKSEPRAQQRALPARETLAIASSLVAYPGVAAAASESPAVLGIPVDFILFALTLLGVALFHRHALPVALTGLTTITIDTSRSPGSRSVRASRGSPGTCSTSG